MLRAASEHPRPVPPNRQHRHRRPRTAKGLPAILLVIALLLAPVEFSLGQALTAPGQATVSVRLVEWLRDHGAGPVVDIVESWWYAHNRPTGTAPDPASLPRVALSTMEATAGVHPGPLPATGSSRLPGEAVWVPSTQCVGVSPPLYTAFFRPQPDAPSVIAGVAWMNQSVLRARLVAGTTDPVAAGGEARADTDGAQVPGPLRASLLATFNSGFKLKHARGGYYAGGREVRPLRDGAASLAIDTAGHVRIGQWGRDLTLTPATTAVRQNLALIVDGGAAVPGLDTNSSGAWGTARNQLQYTWRSGLGLDAGGNLVYVAADQLSLTDLARALTAAGAVRGMELDIHPQTVSFLSYRPGQAAAGTGTRLLPTMRTLSSRHLVPDQRDFLAVTARDTPGGP